MKTLKNSPRADARDTYAGGEPAESLLNPSPEAMDAISAWLKRLALGNDPMLRKLGWNAEIALGRIKLYIALVELPED